MIRFTVQGHTSAENALADLWSKYPNRHDVTEAADRLDAELRTDAHKKGFELAGDVRALSSSPISVYFRVDQPDRKVFVESVVFAEIN